MKTIRLIMPLVRLGLTGCSVILEEDAVAQLQK